MRAIGNRTLSTEGYVLVATGPKQHRYEHILIAERAIGRRLKKGEVVHHVNCVRSDNRPSNLLICSHAYHMALHARMRKYSYWRDVTFAAKAINKKRKCA
jgi:hypothetical protein